MGIELVKTVAAKGGYLRGNEYKVLIYMATIALDRKNEKGQEPKRFFGGHDSLAFALGKEGKDTRGRAEAVRRAIQGLERHGLIQRQVKYPRAGERQCFKLTLENFPDQAEPPQNSVSEPPQNSGPEPLRNSVSEPPQNSGPEPLRNSVSEPPQNSVSSPLETWGPRRSEERGAGLTTGSTTHPPAQPSGSAREACACGSKSRTSDGDCVACGLPRAA